MERLWAPWRFPWIRESKNGVNDCFICDAIKASEDNDRDNLILLRGSLAFIIINRFPYSNGHLMVCPVRHIADLRELRPEEWQEIGLLTQKSIEVLERVLTPHGFNLGWNIGQISGAGLEQHIHQHIVPRWSGDTNFLPVVGETKIISQDLWESYDQLFEALESI